MLVPSDHEFLMVNFPCRIKYIESLHGKISQMHGSVIAFEHHKFLELISHYLPDPLNNTDYADFHKYLRKSKLLDEFSD